MNASAAWLALALGTVLLGACARTGQKPLPALSTKDRFGNAPVVAAFVRRACVDASADPRHAVQIIGDTGWKFRQVQRGNDEGELNMWRLPYVQLARAQTPIGAREADVWTCDVEVDGAVAPEIDRMETSLRHDVGNRDVFDSGPGDWHWKPSIFTEGHISVNRGGGRAGSLSIFVEYADLKPLKALFGK